MSTSKLSGNNLLFNADGNIIATNDLTLENSTGTTFTWPTVDPALDGYVLSSTTTGIMTWVPVGTGDVSGPASSTDNAIARFDGTTGKTIQNSGVTIDDSDNITTTGTVNADQAVITNDIQFVAGADHISVEAPVGVLSTYTITLPAIPPTAESALISSASGALGYYNIVTPDRFYAEKTSTQTVTNGVETTIVSYNDLKFQNSGGGFVSSTGVYTATEDGLYRIWGSCAFDSATWTLNRTVYIKIIVDYGLGTQFDFAYQEQKSQIATGSFSSVDTGTAQGIGTLYVGQTVQIRVYQNRGYSTSIPTSFCSFGLEQLTVSIFTP